MGPRTTTIHRPIHRRWVTTLFLGLVFVGPASAGAGPDVDSCSGTSTASCALTFVLESLFGFIGDRNAPEAAATDEAGIDIEPNG